MHASHAVPFASARNEPAKHGAHSALPNDADTLPGEHGTGATLPVEQLEPGRQARHCSGAERSVALEKRPLGHGNAAAAPSAQY